jgi:alkylhydroperoxidase family enzyme
MIDIRATHEVSDSMARISLIEAKDHPELAELIEQIVAGRRGGLLNVYKLLLHSPPLAATWLEHVNAVRWKTEIDGRLREIVIIRIAFLNRIDYVIQQHVPHLAQADGVSLAECEALRDWRASNLFSAKECAVLAYADAMTRDVSVTDAAFAELKPHFNEREIVELTVLIGTYNMHNRVMLALGIDLEPPSG